MNDELSLGSTGIESDLFLTLFYAGLVFFAIFIPAMIVVSTVVKARGRERDKNTWPLASKALFVMGAQVPINLILTLVMFTVRRSLIDSTDRKSMIIPILFSVAVVTVLGSLLALLIALVERRYERPDTTYYLNDKEG